ncbi:MAG: cell wall hydrolase [Rhizobiales bacterium]|jgi:spore germination cell wall hydrolase CwlJ-like protein|nr:cell wall hydrolase [Hyphomicrobiales bacterium]
MASVLSFRKSCLLLALLASGLAGCATAPSGGFGGGYSRLSQRDCLARVMYFESNRSSTDGMVAVGTVVMNRKSSGKYPSSVCGVVGQRNQFAEGALWKKMSEPASKARAYAAADAVLAGQRHPDVGKAMFFHTAGYSYRYDNMDYQVVAGGNAFYDKRRPLGPRPMVSQAAVARAPGVDNEERLELTGLLVADGFR